MENKTTTELLDLYSKLIDKEGNILNQEKYDEWWKELKTREPFFTLLDDDYEDALPALKEEIEDLKEEIKKLRRHKHDVKTNDVMIRI